MKSKPKRIDPDNPAEWKAYLRSLDPIRSTLVGYVKLTAHKPKDQAYLRLHKKKEDR